MSTASDPTLLGARIAAPSPQRILPGLIRWLRSRVPAGRAANPEPTPPIGTLEDLSEHWQYDLGLRDARPARSVPGGLR